MFMAIEQLPIAQRCRHSCRGQSGSREPDEVDDPANEIHVGHEPDRGRGELKDRSELLSRRKLWTNLPDRHTRIIPDGGLADNKDAAGRYQTRLRWQQPGECPGSAVSSGLTRRREEYGLR
jgi:hypothetical protein